MSEGQEVLLGLVMLFFAFIGLITTGKKAMEAARGMQARHGTQGYPPPNADAARLGQGNGQDTGGDKA